jgi:hypothetical protein
MILAVENRRAINRGDFEIALMLGVKHMHVRE